MSNQTRIHYLSHATVLIRHGDHFLLTDPWYQQPAFGSWLPIPPMAIHPSYLVALASRPHSFCRLISHGHDDHLDDDWLTEFPSHTPVYISHFASPGVRKRVERTGLRHIFELDTSPCDFGPFRLRAFLEPEISLDDSVQVIETPDAAILHANDLWQPMRRELILELRELLARHPPKRRLYMSQTNQADGYPFIYPQYTEAERNSLRREKVELVVRSGLGNARDLDCHYFLSYAGHATAFVQNPPDGLAESRYMPLSKVRTLAENVAPDVEVLDCCAGDCFDFERVEHLLGVRIDDEDIDVAARAHYRHFGQIDACYTYRFREPSLSAETRQELLSAFITGFDAYVQDGIQRKGFRPAVLGKTVALGSADDAFWEAIEIGNGRIPVEPRNPLPVMNSHFKLALPLLDRVLLGEVRWEDTYIGYQCEVSKEPRDFHNGDIVRWMGMFGYVYALRIAPKLRKAHGL